MLNKLRLMALVYRQTLMVILSLALFFGGVVILVSHIPVWSLFFGLMITPLGVVLTIFTLDEVARKLLVPPPFRPVKCSVCGKTTYAKEEKENVVCGLCREGEIDELLREKARI